MPKGAAHQERLLDRVVAGDPEPPLAWAQQRRQHLDRRRLAGAVGAEKAEDDARLHRERDVVDRGEAVEALDQIAGLNDRGGHFKWVRGGAARARAISLVQRSSRRPTPITLDHVVLVRCATVRRRYYVPPFVRRLGSEGPARRSRDEMALKVEGVVSSSMHAEQALSGSSRFEPLHLALGA
jgi:hypothetical protein